MGVCYKCGVPITGKSWYGLHTSCFQKWFNTPSLESFKEVAARYDPQEPSEYLKMNSSFFHGKYRKYSANLMNDNYILKVEQEEFPELPAAEYLCNQIFALIGLNVPAFYLIRFEGDLISFVTKNFISDRKEEALDHIYHFIKPSMSYSCETLIKVIDEVTGRITAQEDFVTLTLADSLVGNNDRHGRNLGFIRSAKGLILAPFYDNPSALGVEIPALLGADLQPRGAIETKDTAEPTMKDYVKEWNRLGFYHVVEHFRAKLVLGEIQSLIESSFISQKRKSAFLRLIEARYTELWS